MRFKRPNGRNGQKGNEETISRRGIRKRREFLAEIQFPRASARTAIVKPPINVWAMPEKGRRRRRRRSCFRSLSAPSAHLSERMDDRKK